MLCNSTSLIKIIIADDHNLFLDGLEQILNDTSGFNIIAKVNSGHRLLQVLNDILPDLILLDISMPVLNISLPEIDGIESAIRIKMKYPGIKIVFISMNYNTQLKPIMEKHGIDGFIPKSANASEFKETLLSVIMGNKIFILPDEVTEPTPLLFSHNSDFIKLYKLTKTEIEIIESIAQGDSTKIIASKRNLSYLTIESHRKNIFRKLHAKNMAEVVAFAAKHKLIK